MAKFHTTKDIASSIDRIIRKSEKFLIIFSPYIQFSDTFYERLKSACDRNIYVAIIYRKKGQKDMTQKEKIQEKLLLGFNCNVLDKNNLHAKCYINEKEAIICSMNFYSYSEANNVEMGVLLTKSDDEIEYSECLSEIKEVIKNAKSIKMVEPKLEPDITESRTKPLTNKIYKSLYLALKRNYKSFGFDYNDEMKEFVSKTIYGDRIQLSNIYGFISVQFIQSRKLFKDFKKTHEDIIDEELIDYRVFWHDSNDRICLYTGNGIEFSSLEEEIEYYLKGTKILLDNIKKYIDS